MGLPSAGDVAPRLRGSTGLVTAGGVEEVDERSPDPELGVEPEPLDDTGP